MYFLLDRDAMRAVLPHVGVALVVGYALQGALLHLLLMPFWYLPPLAVLTGLSISRRVTPWRSLAIVAIGFGCAFLAALLLFGMIVGSQ